MYIKSPKGLKKHIILPVYIPKSIIGTTTDNKARIVWACQWFSYISWPWFSHYSFPLLFPIHNPSSHTHTLLLGFFLSLVHDGELTRAALSVARSQTVTQVGVWHFISHLLISALTHTHTHAHGFSVSHKHTVELTHSHKGAEVVASLLKYQPIKTWFSAPEERGWHVSWSSIRSQFSVFFSAPPGSDKPQGCNTWFKTFYKWDVGVYSVFYTSRSTS